MSQQLLGTQLNHEDNPYSHDWQRLSALHNQPLVDTTMRLVRKAADQLRLDPLIVETAYLYLSKLRRDGARYRRLAAPVLALACRNHNPSMNLGPVARAFGLTTLTLSIRMHGIADELHILVRRPETRRKLMEAVGSLGLPQPFYLEAITRSDQLVLDVGMTERTRFGAVLYDLCKKAGLARGRGHRRGGVSQADIARAVGVSEYTIREAYCRYVAETTLKDNAK